MLFQPEKEWDLSEEEKEIVMMATAYIEDNYGKNIASMETSRLVHTRKKADYSGRPAMINL